jgi:serine protease Do
MRHRQRQLGIAFSVGLLCILLAAMPGLAGRQTVYLKNGMIVRGEVLKQKPDVVLVDLGFTVLSVPTEEVERIASEEKELEAPQGEDLFQVAPGREELSVEQNVDRCAEAVVEIRTTIGMGSGFIINPDGYVITNDHVIAGEHKITITVFKQDPRELRKLLFENVRIVATNPSADLALLKIEDRHDEQLMTLPFGDSDELFQGQTVFAIGSPLGFERTVSEGIVSIRNRSIAGQLFIQSTVQVNFGNSGGPLINLRGEVVGVNNMKITQFGVEGMSFAVPVSTIKEFLRNRDAYAFDQRNPNAGYIYNSPPTGP